MVCDAGSGPSRARATPGRWLRGANRGWLLFGLALACLLALAVVDRGLKDAPHGGFCPEDASLVAFAAQWPAFWNRVQDTDVGRAAADPLGKLSHEAALPILRRTGIRPTPARWRLWLGPSVLAGWRGEGNWGVCVRPGILARIAHTGNCLLTGQIGARAIYRVARRVGGGARTPVYYAWRDGFLLISPGREYLLSALSAPPQPYPTEDSGLATLEWRHEVSMELAVTPYNGLPVRAALSASVTADPAPLRLADAWPDTPMLTLTAASWPHGRALAVALVALFPPAFVDAFTERFVPLAREVWGFDRLDSAWSKDIDECALAVAPGTVWPEVAVALGKARTDSEGEHPLLATIAPEDRLPAAWAPDTLGTMAPRLGETWTLCLDEDPAANLWLATTSEAAMARLRGRIAPRDATPADYALRVRWPAAGQAMATVLQALVHAELIPGWGGEDLNSALEGLESITQHMGAARLTGTVKGGQIVFEGLLAEQEQAAQ